MKQAVAAPTMELRQVLRADNQFVLQRKFRVALNAGEYNETRYYVWLDVPIEKETPDEIRMRLALETNPEFNIRWPPIER